MRLTQRIDGHPPGGEEKHLSNIRCTFRSAILLLFAQYSWGTLGWAQSATGAVGASTSLAPLRVVATSQPAVVATTPGPVTQPVRFRLGNGLDVILEENHRIPQVAVRVRYHVGSRDDPAGYSGLAHTTEHAMFERAARGQPSYFLAVAQLGVVEFNGETSPDSTDYYAVVSAERLAALLWLESDRMAFMPRQLTERRFANATIAVRNEYRERIEANMLHALRLEATRAMYPANHPYFNVDERASDLAAIHQREVIWFFQQWYTPANATLVVVGDFSTAVVRPLIEQYFGTVSSVPPRTRAPSVYVDARRNQITATVATSREYVMAYWPTPSYLTDDDAALDVVAALMTSDIDHSLAARIAARFSVGPRTTVQQQSAALGSEFAVEMQIPPEHRWDEVVTVVEQALDDLVRLPPSQQALRVAKEQYIRDCLSSRETNSLRAFKFAQWAEYSSGDPDMTAVEVARYERLSGLMIQNAARRWLGRDRRLLVVVQRGPVAEAIAFQSPGAGSN